MGNIFSTGHGGVEEAPLTSGAYKYPPANGQYFANHFIMGGEKFDSPQPEAFLFGENADLNFLGGKPVPFPYPPPQANEPTKTLRSLINIRRDSVHFVAAPPLTGGVLLAAPEDDNLDASDADGGSDSQVDMPDDRVVLEDPKKTKRYNIQFTFDSDVRCAITIYYFCQEEIGSQGVTYIPRETSLKSETYYFKRGASQLFSQPAHVFQPGIYPENWLTYGDDVTHIPLAIHCVSMEGDAPRQSHTTFGIVERSSDGTGFILKAFKQKLFVDGLSYLLQEIYGLENKTTDVHPNQYDDADDDDECGGDCVVCMCDLRDTIILPCRHLCLCYACAESLRYQANNCPICRAPFIALLQIRAVQRINHATHPALAGTEPGGQDGVPQGYQAISLVEALNGNEPVVTMPPVLSLVGSAEASSSRPTSSSSSTAAKKSSRSKRRGSQESRSKRSHSVTSPTSTTAATSTVVSEDGDVGHERAQSAATSATTDGFHSMKVVKLKIVNEVGSHFSSPNLDQSRSSTSAERRPLTPPSLDLVDEELAHLDVKDGMIGGKANGLKANKVQSLKKRQPQTEPDFDESDVDGVPPTAALVSASGIASSLPGTPMSGVSVRSSQDSASSATSTKQLLPTVSVSVGGSSGVITSSAADRKSSSPPVTVTFTPAATIVKVVPSMDGDDDEDEDDDDDEDGMC